MANETDYVPIRKATTWTVKYGDTLVGISREIYGSSDYWMYIYNANRGKIHDPDSLKNITGKVLVIPPIRKVPVNGETAIAFSHRGATSWTIQYGDTLVGISIAVYGTSEYSHFLYEKNKQIIDAVTGNPASLKKLVGFPLTVPQNPDTYEELPPEFASPKKDNNDLYYSLIIQHNNKAFQPAVKDGVKIEWCRNGAPGKLTFTVLKAVTQSYGAGDTVKFYYKGKLVFLGYVFTKHRTKKGEIETVAYDQTRYLKNKFAYVFQEKTTTQIIKELCHDFGLKVGRLEDSKYKIPVIAEENSEAIDIILNATEETLANTGNMFVLYDDNGYITYKNVLSMKSDTVITAETAEDFDYTSSIDEQTYNRIILYYKPASTNTASDDGSGSIPVGSGGSLPPWKQQYPLYSVCPNGGGYPGQCTWYCGDRLAQFGIKGIPYPMGNGGEWHIAAKNAGYACHYGKPFVGAVADMYPMHVAFVERVNSDGSIYCSEFWGSYCDYIQHFQTYSAQQVANMYFIDFGVRGGVTSTAVPKRKSSIGITQRNAKFSTGNMQGQASVGTSVTRWSNYIIQSSTKYGLPADFVAAIIYHESRGQANATSYAGAMGLMQLMPGTAASMGVSNAYDPQQNIEGGCKLLAYLANYGGVKRSPNVILRMYWGGPGAINNSSLDSYWEDIKKLLPNELTGMSGTATSLNSLENGDNATMQVFKAEDKDSIKRWGVLQYFEQVQTDGIGQDKADSLLKLYNRKSRQFSIKNALGDVTVRGGTMIPVILDIGDVIVKNYMLVEKVTHKFYHHKHVMDIDLEGAYDDE